MKNQFTKAKEWWMQLTFDEHVEILKHTRIYWELTHEQKDNFDKLENTILLKIYKKHKEMLIKV
jgi:hypothetical protein